KEASGTAIATYDDVEPTAHTQETAATPGGIDMTTTTAATKEISSTDAAAPSRASALPAPTNFPDFQLRGN
ncbi:hypothetical protein, partial [Staphylococcus aureus]